MSERIAAVLPPRPAAPPGESAFAAALAALLAGRPAPDSPFDAPPLPDLPPAEAALLGRAAATPDLFALLAPAADRPRLALELAAAMAKGGRGLLVAPPFAADQLLRRLAERLPDGVARALARTETADRLPPASRERTAAVLTAKLQGAHGELGAKRTAAADEAARLDAEAEPLAARLALWNRREDARRAAEAPDDESLRRKLDASRRERDDLLARPRDEAEPKVTGVRKLLSVFSRPAAAAAVAEPPPRLAALEAEVADLEARLAEGDAARRRAFEEADAAWGGGEPGDLEAKATEAAGRAADARRRLEQLDRFAGALRRDAGQIEERILKGARVVVAPPGALGADPLLAPGFDWVLVAGDEPLSDRELLALAALGRRGVVLADARPGGRPWGRLPVAVRRDAAGRCVVHFSAGDADAGEPLADRPDVELAASGGDLRSLSFAPGWAYSDVRRFLLDELGEARLAPLGPAEWSADGLRACWPAAERLGPPSAELEPAPGVVERIWDDPSGIGWTQAVTFDAAAGWTPDAAREWVEEHARPARGARAG